MCEATSCNERICISYISPLTLIITQITQLGWLERQLYNAKVVPHYSCMHVCVADYAVHANWHMHSLFTMCLGMWMIVFFMYVAFRQPVALSHQSPITLMLHVMGAGCRMQSQCLHARCAETGLSQCLCVIDFDAQATIHTVDRLHGGGAEHTRTFDSGPLW